MGTRFGDRISSVRPIPDRPRRVAKGAAVRDLGHDAASLAIEADAVRSFLDDVHG